MSSEKPSPAALFHPIPPTPVSYWTREEFTDIARQLARLIPLLTLISSGIMYVVLVELLESGEGSYWRTLLASFVYSAVFTTALTIAFRLMDYYVPLSSPKAVLQHVAVMSLLTLLCYFSSASITSYFIFNDATPALSSRLITFLITVMITVAILGIFYIQLFMSRNKEARKKAVDAELAALRAQINPHFLFNSLNSIAALAHLDADKSEEVTEDLAELFRYSLNASKKGRVSLGEELEACRLYLRIEQARFGDRLHLTEQLDERLSGHSVPALIVQPLVENAVKHGLQKQRGSFELGLKTEVRDGRLCIIVTDTGPGMDPERQAEYLDNGTGLSNVGQRLRAQYGASASLHILENGVALSLPHKPSKEK